MPPPKDDESEELEFEEFFNIMISSSSEYVTCSDILLKRIKESNDG